MLGPKNSDLKSISEFNSAWADRLAYLILAGLLVDIADLFIPEGWWKIVAAIGANLLIFGGVWGELWFAKRARDADDSRVAEANARAAEANKFAEEERHARVKLEAQLRPRTLSDEHIDMIETLRDKFPVINIAREVDIETHVFAQEIALAFMAAGIGFQQYRRAPDVHTAGMMIYAPRGVNNSGPGSMSHWSIYSRK